MVTHPQTQTIDIWKRFFRTIKHSFVFKDINFLLKDERFFSSRRGICWPSNSSRPKQKSEALEMSMAGRGKKEKPYCPGNTYSVCGHFIEHWDKTPKIACWSFRVGLEPHVWLMTCFLLRSVESQECITFCFVPKLSAELKPLQRSRPDIKIIARERKWARPENLNILTRHEFSRGKNMVRQNFTFSSVKILWNLSWKYPFFPQASDGWYWKWLSRWKKKNQAEQQDTFAQSDVPVSIPQNLRF